ncbi:MAG: hypothetical protein N4A47_00240 [Clostridia bacterium]|jgi:hypothetical protein|nr:hypothetical protein [Clostridia bacterium]
MKKYFKILSLTLLVLIGATVSTYAAKLDKTYSDIGLMKAIFDLKDSSDEFEAGMSSSKIKFDSDLSSLSDSERNKVLKPTSDSDEVTFKFDGYSYEFNYDVGDNEWTQTSGPAVDDDDDDKKADGILGDLTRNTDSEEIINDMYGVISPLISNFGSVLIFFAVVMVGFDVIRHKNNAEERTKSMTSILFLAVGALIIGAASLIASFVWSLKTNTEDETSFNTVEVVRELNM